MNKNHRSFTTRAMVVAVHGALLAMAAMPIAYADEEMTAAELTQPTSTVEVGVRDVGVKNLDSTNQTLCVIR